MVCGLEGGPKLRIVVTDQVLGRVVKRRGLAQLLRDPFIARMSGGIDVYSSARADVHDYKGVEHLEEQRDTGTKSHAQMS
jgi:hypothetical protein